MREGWDGGGMGGGGRMRVSAVRLRHEIRAPLLTGEAQGEQVASGASFLPSRVRQGEAAPQAVHL